MQSPHTRSACPDCSQKTLLLDLPFPIAELWMWKHTACADPRGRAQADAQHTEHLCFVPVSVTHLLLSGGHTHTHTDVNSPLFVPPRIASSLLLGPKSPQKSLLGVGRREDERGKNHIISATILSEGKLDYLNVKFLRYLHDCPLKTLVIERCRWELRCWHSTWAHVFLWCA